MNDPVHVALIDTPHFSFAAVDTSTERARRALMRGWRAHCKEYPGAEPDFVKPDDICIHPMQMGQCDRDGERITGPGVEQVTEPELWNDDLVQFARLISEMQVEGCFTAEIVAKLVNATDLAALDICALIDRADVVFQQTKSQL